MAALRMCGRAGQAARLAEPHETAASVAFQGSPDASYITGRGIQVDGGLI